MVGEEELVSEDDPGYEVMEDEAYQESGEGKEHRNRRRGLTIILLIILHLLIWCCLWWRCDCFRGLVRSPDQDSISRTTVRTGTIPDVTGMTKEDAIKVLEAAGFKVETETSFDTVADPNTVVSQDPPGGSTATLGSTVFITVTEPLGAGSGPLAGDEDELVEVPDVVGWPRATAVDEIRSAGFVVKVTGIYSDTVPEGVVISQTPAGGASAPEGSVVSILVSLGSAPENTVPVPSLKGKTASQASAAIRAAGLEPRLLYQPNKHSIGKVYQQSPAAGTEVAEDRLVFVLIGLDYWWKAPNPDISPLDP